jgi:hypothetical protein
VVEPLLPAPAAQPADNGSPVHPWDRRTLLAPRLAALKPRIRRSWVGLLNLAHKGNVPRSVRVAGPSQCIAATG